MEHLGKNPEPVYSYSLKRGTYKRPKKADLREVDNARENRPYFTALAALEMCGIAPTRASIEENWRSLQKMAEDFPLGDDKLRARKILMAEADAKIVEIETDAALLQLMRHDVYLANMFYHELNANMPGAISSIIEKTKDFNQLPCLLEITAMEKKGLIGNFTRRVASNTLRIMIALENNLIESDERQLYDQLVARHVKSDNGV